MGNMCVIYILHMLLFSALDSSLGSVSWESYYRLLKMLMQDSFAMASNKKSLRAHSHHIVNCRGPEDAFERSYMEKQAFYKFPYSCSKQGGNMCILTKDL